MHHPEISTSCCCASPARPGRLMQNGDRHLEPLRFKGDTVGGTLGHTLIKFGLRYVISEG